MIVAAWLFALKTQGTKLDEVGVPASTRLLLDRLASSASLNAVFDRDFLVCAIFKRGAFPF
jgi:hypothetical protein